MCLCAKPSSQFLETPYIKQLSMQANQSVSVRDNEYSNEQGSNDSMKLSGWIHVYMSSSTGGNMSSSGSSWSVNTSNLD